jgi:L-ascorbate metabolism protein UlaG (beta-lactamase superfamily)
VNNDLVFLKPNVAVKPLVNRWIAREQLIPPASLAMHIKNGHLALLSSYLSAPEYHVKAAHSPALVGGPWVDIPVERKAEVKELLERTKSEQKHMLDFADALLALNKLLQEEAKGASLEPMYERIPEILRGYVELVYDSNHKASFRLIEGLLYRSPYYDPSLQSFALSLVDQDARPFQWTTPWLDDDQHVHLRIPFVDEAVDMLFSMKTQARPYGEIRERLGIAAGDEALFRSFFTDVAPKPAPRYSGEGVRVRYFGHACVLIESKGTSVMTDPIVSYQYPTSLDRFTFMDLPERIDYAVITHAHFDHIYFETILQLRHKIGQLVVPKNGGGTVIDPAFKMMLEKVGFKNVVEVDDLDSFEVDGGRVTALPFFGEHGDLNIQSKAAHLVELEGNSLVCAADSSNVEPYAYARVHDLVGDIDVLFLGMECSGAPVSMVYGPLLTAPLDRKADQSRRTTGSDYDRAISLVDEFNIKQAYIYAMGIEPWLKHILPVEEEGRDHKAIDHSDRFVAECTARGIVAERLFARKEFFLEPKS